jgi:hypothetical protein
MSSSLEIIDASGHASSGITGRSGEHFEQGAQERLKDNARMQTELPGLVEARIVEELEWASLEEAEALLDALHPGLYVFDEKEREERHQCARHYGNYTAQRSLASLCAASHGTRAMSARRQGELQGGMDGEQHEDMARMRLRDMLERYLGAAVSAAVLPWNNKLPQPPSLRASIEATTGTTVEEAASGRRDRKWKLEELLRVMGYYPRTMSEEAQKYIDDMPSKTRATLKSAVAATTKEWEERHGEDWRETVRKSRWTCRQALRSTRGEDATFALCAFCSEVGRMDGACEGRWLRRGGGCREDGGEVVCLCHECYCGEPTKRPIEFRCGCAFEGERSFYIE